MSDDSLGSIAVRRRIGARLRKKREDLGYSLRDVASQTDISAPKLSKIENGKTAIKRRDIWDLCRHYHVDEEETERLAVLSVGTTQDNWWEEYGPEAVPEELTLYYALEEIAASLRFFDPVLVPGLLQTEDYATAILSSSPDTPADVVQKRLKFRLGRQTKVRERGVSLTAVLGAGALALQVGSSTVMADQLAFLRELDQSGAAKILVLPWTVGAYPMGRGTFTLMDFSEKEDPPTAYIEIPGGARYEERPEEMVKYDEHFKMLVTKSIPIGDYTS